MHESDRSPTPERHGARRVSAPSAASEVRGADGASALVAALVLQLALIALHPLLIGLPAIWQTMSRAFGLAERPSLELDPSLH